MFLDVEDLQAGIFKEVEVCLIKPHHLLCIDFTTESFHDFQWLKDGFKKDNESFWLYDSLDTAQHSHAVLLFEVSKAPNTEHALVSLRSLIPIKASNILVVDLVWS